MAVAGIDVDEVLSGACAQMLELRRRDMDNPAWQYAAVRNALYEGGRKIELLACYEPSFRFMTEWWKQLFGESEGKDGRGIFPAGLEFPADLHSMGQYLQEGERSLFETVVRFSQARSKVSIPEDKLSGDGLDFLTGRELAFAARQAMDGTLLAHTDGGLPNLILHVPAVDARSFGAMVYFFELACALSGYVLGVNPFDQPGVERYKKNMFALLGKPGSERLRDELLQKMKRRTGT
jgi:glucose-6-phosphate isomerase